MLAPFTSGCAGLAGGGKSSCPLRQPDAAAESGRLLAGIYKYNALRFRGKEDVLLVILICSHLKTVELHFRVALGLFNELIAVDLDTDFLQMEIRQCDGIAVTLDHIRSLLLRRIDIEGGNVYKDLFAKAGGVDP